MNLMQKYSVRRLRVLTLVSYVLGVRDLLSPMMIIYVIYLDLMTVLSVLSMKYYISTKIIWMCLMLV